MPYDITKVLDIARGQIGYLEKETWNELDDFTANAGDENYVKYSRDLAKYSYFNGSKKGVAWCSIFVAWCFVQAFGESAAHMLQCQPYSDNCGAGCNSAMNYFKRKGQLKKSSPQPGDVVFFWNSEKKEASHTGIVEKVDATYVYTIEGNTSSASDVIANGGTVAAKKYKLNNARIAGYGRPDYSIGIQPSNNENENTSESEEVISVTDAWVNVANGTTVNFRQKPSKSAPKVKGMPTIKHGEKVQIVSLDGDWAAVAYNSYNGYIMLNFLTVDKPVTSNAQSIDEVVSEITVLLQKLAAMAKS